MGQAFRKLFDAFFGTSEMRVVMLGLDAAGKTTILYKLHIGEVLSTVPTIGFNVEKVHYKNVMFTVWDVGGQEKLRPLLNILVGAETAASAKMEDVLAPNHILGNTTISPNHCFPAPVIKPSATNVANSRAMGTPICPTPGVMVSSHTGVSTELSIKDERELKREKRK